MDANERIEAVYKAYSRKVTIWMEKINRAMIVAGFVTTPVDDMSSDHYMWTFDAWLPEHDGDDDLKLGVELEIGEAQSYGDDPEDGVNFMFRVARWGGVLLAEFCPYNYTEHCWVSASDEAALAERWELFEGALTTDSQYADLLELIGA